MSEPDPEPQQRAAQLQVEVVLAAEPVVESAHPIADLEHSALRVSRRLPCWTGSVTVPSEYPRRSQSWPPTAS